MTSAFCPGHITCFFMPGGPSGGDALKKGSAGAGIRISTGAAATVSPSENGGVHIFIDGNPSDAPVTRYVVDEMLPGRSVTVRVENDVPMGEGFGMSAAGAIAVALCCAEIAGVDDSVAYQVAHRAEIAGGGGLGDVSAIMADAHVPVRVEPGLPPNGKVESAPIGFDRLTLVVLGPKMNTGVILGDEDNYTRIVAAGFEAMKEFGQCQTKEKLFEVSNAFADRTGVESAEVRGAIALLGVRGINAAMCMLGNSIFADASPGEIRQVLGDVRTYECSSTDVPAQRRVKS